MEQAHRFFVGIDWATEAHQVCILDGERRVVEERSVEHSGIGLAALADRLAQLAQDVPESIAVSIEVPRGPVVETLLGRGFAVYAINPKQLDRFRDRHTVAGAKDDRRDAFVLADSLRTDLPAFHRARTDDPLVIQIREASRTYGDLVEDLGRLCCQLRELLLRYHPSVLRLSSAVDDPWVWELLEKAGTPDRGARLRHVDVTRILRAHRIRRLTADEVLAVLRSPALRLAPGTVEAASEHVALLIPRLQLVHRQRKQCEKWMDNLLARLSGDDDGAGEPVEGKQREHRDVEILQSLPGIGRVIAATMLAEASRPLAERDYHALRADAGIAPVTRQSGKRSVVGMRYGCNGRLRHAVYHMARVSSQCNPQSRAHYAAARARGLSHPRAVRAVADRLLSVLVAMLEARTLYDATRARRSPYAPPITKQATS